MLRRKQYLSLNPPTTTPIDQNTAQSNHPVLVKALGFRAERCKGYYDNADFGKTLKALIEDKNHE